MNKEDVANIFSLSEGTLSDEVFETIVEAEGKFRLERIISEGHATPEGDWYDQDHDEWVLLLRGSAELLFQSSGKKMTLKPGDCLNIPAHEKHRVIATDSKEKTVWLALHYKGKDSLPEG